MLEFAFFNHMRIMSGKVSPCRNVVILVCDYLIFHFLILMWRIAGTSVIILLGRKVALLGGIFMSVCVQLFSSTNMHICASFGTQTPTDAAVFL